MMRMQPHCYVIVGSIEAKQTSHRSYRQDVSCISCKTRTSLFSILAINNTVLTCKIFSFKR
jgi:hypothetical protein